MTSLASHILKSVACEMSEPDHLKSNGYGPELVLGTSAFLSGTTGKLQIMVWLKEEGSNLDSTI